MVICEMSINNTSGHSLRNKTIILNLKVYLPLSPSHACRFSISSLVGEPEPRFYMLNVTDGVSIIDFWDPHAIDIRLCARVELLL